MQMELYFELCAGCFGCGAGRSIFVLTGHSTDSAGAVESVCARMQSLPQPERVRLLWHVFR